MCASNVYFAPFLLLTAAWTPAGIVGRAGGSVVVIDSLLIFSCDDVFLRSETDVKLWKV